MIGKLTSLLSFIKHFFSFFNNYLLPQIETFIDQFVNSYRLATASLNVYELSFQPMLAAFILSVMTITVVKMVLNR